MHPLSKTLKNTMNQNKTYSTIGPSDYALLKWNSFRMDDPTCENKTCHSVFHNFNHMSVIVLAQKQKNVEVKLMA